MLKSCAIRHGIPASCRTQLSSSLASTWITERHTPRHRSMAKESDRPQLAEKPLDSGAGPEKATSLEFCQTVLTAGVLYAPLRLLLPRLQEPVHESADSRRPGACSPRF